MKTALIICAALLLGLAAFLRLQPPDARRAHVAPETAPFKDQSGVRIVGDDAAVFTASPDAVLEAFGQVVANQPQTDLLAGSPGEGMVTFVTRTRTWAFQDYITARAEATPGGTRLTIAARTRYPGASDWGVNRNRLEQWLLELAERLGEAG